MIASEGKSGRTDPRIILLSGKSDELPASEPFRALGIAPESTYKAIGALKQHG